MLSEGVETTSGEADGGASGAFELDKASAVSWLGRDRRPRVIVDRALRVLWANPAARRDLTGESPVFIADGRLRFADSRGEHHWAAVLAGLDDEGARIAITTPDGHRCVVLSALPQTVGRVRAVLLKITLGRPKLDFAESGLAAYFELTPAEAQVGEQLAEPNPPSKIARELGISIHTVRTHVRGLYAKLAVRSHAQFMRLVHTFCST